MRLLKCATLIMAVFFNLRFVSGQGQCVTPSLTLPTYSSTLNCSGSYLDYSVNPSSPQDEPIITIRVNIHVIENSTHTGNFLNNAATINFLSGLFAADNTISPHTMNFTPYGHVEPATWTINLGGGPVPFISDTRIRFRLTGIYFHTDDIGWNYNNNSSCGDYCFTNWGINKYQDINIFFFNYTGPAFGCGPRAGYINMGANWSSYDVNDVSNLWGIRTLLGHEMGHILGLSHTAFWDGITSCAISDDAFDDTPYPDNGHFNNCVPLNGTQTGCNVVSNNVMGYNQCKGYFSPKQIASMRYYTSAHLKSYMYCPITPSTQYNITTTQVWNTEKILDGSLKIALGGNLTVDCKLFMPQNITIEVESGGQLTIDGVLGSVCEGGWDGLIDVKPGGILRLSADAEVTLKGNGKILIEDDPTNPGKLIFEQGAEVYLDDFTSSIEINGNLEIANNATFEFKHHAFQHGYVKFGNTSQFPSRNITAGSSASINLVGSAINLTVLEIDQETFYAPASLVNFNISNGRVVFNAGSRLQADGYGTNINFTASKFTSNTPGVNNGHRGVHLYGQPNISIIGCIFEYGRYGIFAYQTYGGNSLNIINSTFRHNTYGIDVRDRGLGLFRCNFFNNAVGVLANAMTYPSLFFEGITGGNVASSNVTGISWQSFSTGSLTLEDPLINTNHTGVQPVNCPLYVKCGSISYNYYGIVCSFWANLMMDDNVITPNTAANVSVFNNYFSIRAVNAWYLWLNKGGNDLSPSSINNEKTAYGTLTYQPLGIIANTNIWNSLGTFSPSDINLRDQNNNPYNIIDNNIQTSITGCGQAVPPCPNPPCPIQSPLEYCPACDEINTDDFTGVKLNIATQVALAKLNSNDPDKYIDAVAIFCQILNEQYLNPDDREKYLLSLNYIKMMEALGNAFKYDQIECLENGLPELVSQVSTIQDLLIDNAVSNGN